MSMAHMKMMFFHCKQISQDTQKNTHHLQQRIVPSALDCWKSTKRREGQIWECCPLKTEDQQHQLKECSCVLCLIQWHLHYNMQTRPGSSTTPMSTKLQILVNQAKGRLVNVDQKFMVFIRYLVLQRILCIIVHAVCIYYKPCVNPITEWVES